jgi:hypothetical protein
VVILHRTQGYIEEYEEEAKERRIEGESNESGTS